MELCRRMLRSGLGKKVLPTSSPSNLFGGAFSVPKDLDRDRFIGGRRPRSGSERLIGKCHLPWAPRLRRLMLPSVSVIRMPFRDVSDCHCTQSVEKERLQRQVLGPRVPVSWCRNLEDTSLDLLPIEGFEHWLSSDLIQNPIRETVDPRRYCQIAVAAVIMGDLNAVYAVETAHRRQLLSVGSLQTRTMLIPGCALLRSATIGDVYTDDLVFLAMVHFSRLHLKDDFIPAQSADTLYESLDMVVSVKKCGSAFEHEV